MAFGASSAVFRAYYTDKMAETVQMPITDTWRLPLWSNTPTPDKDATSANTAFNAGTWLTGSQVTDATNWVSPGKAITGLAWSNPASGVLMLDCNDIASGGNVTLTGFFGASVFDDTVTTPVADQGVSYHSFGGTQTVTANPFTAIVDPNGLFRFTG